MYYINTSLKKSTSEFLVVAVYKKQNKKIKKRGKGLLKVIKWDQNQLFVN